MSTNNTYLTTINSLPVYKIHTFDAYPYLDYAIFTRKGGTSHKPFQSLNLSKTVGDAPQTVEDNINLVCRTLNIHPHKTVSSRLIHGVNIVTVHQANRQQVRGPADGLITNKPRIYLFMRFGDCTPLIFFDPTQQAIGLTHAGWRGTLKDAAGATVEAMVNQLGCVPQNINAVIGPAIGPCCYQVGQDVINGVETAFTNPNNLLLRRNGSHAYFDMWAANKQQLVEAGVKNIFQTNLCTACRTDQFFSHRAEKGQTGRFGIVIGLKEAAV